MKICEDKIEFFSQVTMIAAFLFFLGALVCFLLDRWIALSITGSLAFIFAYAERKLNARLCARYEHDKDKPQKIA